MSVNQWNLRQSNNEALCLHRSFHRRKHHVHTAARGPDAGKEHGTYPPISEGAKGAGGPESGGPASMNSDGGNGGGGSAPPTSEGGNGAGGGGSAGSLESRLTSVLRLGGGRDLHTQEVASACVELLHEYLRLWECARCARATGTATTRTTGPRAPKEGNPPTPTRSIAAARRPRAGHTHAVTARPTPQFGALGGIVDRQQVGTHTHMGTLGNSHTVSARHFGTSALEHLCKMGCLDYRCLNNVASFLQSTANADFCNVCMYVSVGVGYEIWDPPRGGGFPGGG